MTDYHKHLLLPPFYSSSPILVRICIVPSDYQFVSKEKNSSIMQGWGSMWIAGQEGEKGCSVISSLIRLFALIGSLFRTNVSCFFFIFPDRMLCALALSTSRVLAGSFFSTSRSTSRGSNLPDFLDHRDLKTAISSSAPHSWLMDILLMNLVMHLRRLAAKFIAFNLSVVWGWRLLMVNKAFTTHRNEMLNLLESSPHLSWRFSYSYLNHQTGA